MNIRPVIALLLSGATWFSIGVFLMCKGLGFLVELASPGKKAPVIDALQSLSGGREQAILVLICLGLLIGFFKGRVVLSKTVQRMSTHFFSFAQGIPLSKLYPLSYYILISFMVILGISLKWMPIPQEVRGTIDVTIGSALTNGAVLYLRAAIFKKKSTSAS